MGMQQVAELERQGRFEEAEERCRRELRARPFDAMPCHALGLLLHRRGAAGDALELMRRAAALAPSAVQPRVNLAAMLCETGRPEEALRVLGNAVKLRADCPELHNNLGVTLERLEQFAEAAAAYRTAIALREAYPEAHRNLGNALKRLGQPAAAAEAYRASLRLRPDNSKAAVGFAGALCELGALSDSLACLRRAVEIRPDSPDVLSSLLYTLHYSPDCDAAAMSMEHRRWGELFCKPSAALPNPHRNDRQPDRRLRIGYLSPDLREQTVTKFITAGIQYHDRAKIAVFCYSDAEKSDHVTARLRALAERWHDTRALTGRRLEELIREDRIDILVDLRGHGGSNRLTLFALKPAPLQVNMVGYFDTTGLATMDYRITDEHMDPPGQTEQYHTETLIRLPNSCWCYTADDDSPDVTETPALRNGLVTFGSLNKIVKVSEPCGRLWARVLQAVPGSKLLLSVAAADAGGSVRKRLESYGIPSDRLVIADKTRTRKDYLARFGQIDVALDTWPFNGITTTCDGLWMGVPCVSVTGQTSVSRAGKSILHAANLPELATETFDGFVQAASALALDLNRLQGLRGSMRQRLLASPLMDHRAFARNLETAYRTMWRKWASLVRPAHR